jgi:hypothetical protein
MIYLSVHKTKLKHRHYVTTARTRTHWYNFYERPLKKYIAEYGDNFCIVLNCARSFNFAYVLPFKDIKDCFLPEYSKGGRWNGNVIDENLIVSVDGKRKCEMCVGSFRNAFALLQDAPPRFQLMNMSDFLTNTILAVPIESI